LMVKHIVQELIVKNIFFIQIIYIYLYKQTIYRYEKQNKKIF
jgi:hypothetical protein